MALYSCILNESVSSLGDPVGLGFFVWWGAWWGAVEGEEGEEGSGRSEAGEEAWEVIGGAD